SPASHWDYLYEPEAKVVLEQVLTRYIEAIIFQAVAENMSSEQSARMVAMKSASDNAETLIDELTLVYNKNRQAGITKEISEIVGAGIDTECPCDAMPGSYDALVLEGSGEKSFAEKGLTFEVEQQLGDGVVRCISLGSSDGLRRGMKVKSTGSPISVPVGKGT